MGSSIDSLKLFYDSNFLYLVSAYAALLVLIYLAPSVPERIA